MDLKQDNKNSFIENILELITHDVDSSFLATFRMKNKNYLSLSVKSGCNLHYIVRHFTIYTIKHSFDIEANTMIRKE